MTKLFLFVLALVLPVALAQGQAAKKKGAGRPKTEEQFNEPVSNEPVDFKDYYRWYVHEPLVEAAKFKGAPPCPDCEAMEAQLAGEAKEKGAKCPETYREVYRPRLKGLAGFLAQFTQNETPKDLDIRLALGYLDGEFGGEQVSFDKYIAEAMIDNLQVPCQPGTAACGFRIDESDLEAGDFTVLVKMIVDPFSRRKRKVRIVVGHSSESNVEKENLSGFGAFKQQERTRRTENMFLDGLQNANAVFYVGHARKGGGPSFGPPVRNAKGGVDYPYYLRERPGMKKVTEALASSNDPTPLFGAFACRPDDLYKPDLRAATPKTALMLAGRGYFESAAAQAMGAIDSMLALRCEKGTRATMNAIKDVYGKPVDPVTIDGLFNK